MPTARQSQSDLPNRPTYLPPLSPSAKSHPHHAFGTPVPLTYQVKLSSEVFNAIFKGKDQATIEFTDLDQGTIHLPNRADVSFTTHPTNANNDETARAALYSRRRNNMRLVAPVSHMDIHKRPTPAPNIKIGPIKPEKRKTSDSSQRGSKKRQRPPGDSPAQNSTALPPTPSQPYKPNGSAIKVPRSAARNARLPHSSRSPTTQNGKQGGRIPRGSINSIGALGQRFSPPSQPSLPKPIAPSKSRQSPQSISRGGSPNTQTGNAVGLGAKAKLDDGEEIRRHVVHSLALGDMTLHAMRRRHESLNMDSVVLGEVLKEVADLSGDNYKLKKGAWREVYDSHPGYNDGNRQLMRENRAKVCALVDGKLNVELMNDDALQEEIKELSKQFSKGVGEVQNDEEERLARKKYERGYRLYREVIARVSLVNGRFVELKEKLEKCKESGGKEKLKMRIQSCDRRYNESFKRLERVLPKMHGFLKGIREAVCKYEP